MFRALLLLLLFSGQPNFPVSSMTDFKDSAKLLNVSNFQYIPNINSLPKITAKSILAIDLDSQVPLYTHSVQTQRPIASLSKLMTALVILDENNLDDIVTITPDVNQIEGSRIWLYPGEKITTGNLIKGMLIKSGNDAAYELAKFNAGSLAKFSVKMNQKAEELGLKNSHFLDPAGLDDENNFASAQDLAIIAKHILKYPFIRQIVSIKETNITSTDGLITHKLKNTNLLLDSFLGAEGLKTGTTDLAGECLITLLKIKQNDVLIILLGSEDRYLDTKTIYNHLNRL